MLAVLDDRAFLLVLALYVSMLALPFHRVWQYLPLRHIAPGLATAMRTAVMRLNRPQRSAAERSRRGWIFLIMGGVICLVFGWALEGVATRTPEFFAAHVLLLAFLLPLWPCYIATQRVRQAIRGRKLVAARTLLAPWVAQDVAALDIHALIRAALEGLADNLSRRVVLPSVAYLLFGMSGALLAVWSERLAAIADPRAAEMAAFGQGPQRFYQWLQKFPSHLCGALIFLIFPVIPGSSLRRALTAFRGGPRPEWRMVAAVLGVSLGGPRRVSGTPDALTWMGEGSARATLPDLTRGLMLYALAAITWTMLLSITVI
jgi:adenosylcobinamide-phosphate synthase